MIPYSKQSISKGDIKAVTKTLESDFLTTGPKVTQFEEACAKKFNARYAYSFNSATSALHIACLSLGLEKNDIAWTSSMSFVASSNCALYCGAEIDLVDIDSKTFNISINDLERKLIAAKKRNKLPKVLIVVHFAGLPCDMSKVRSLSRQYGFRVIEDASHAVGSQYKNSKIGDCKYSDMTVFSFHSVKIFTTGEGGMVLTNNKKLADKLLLLRSHGVTRDISKFEEKKRKDSPWYYEQQALGFNYRMTDIAAALGLSQLKRVDKWNEKRNKIANRYIESFDPIEGVKFQQHNHKYNYSSYHLFVILIDNRDEIYKKMLSRGIGVNVHYIPIHYHPFYQKLGFKKGQFKNAENYYEKAMTIPLFPALTNREQNYVISTLKNLIRR